MKKFTLLLAFLTLLFYSCGAELQDQEIAGDSEATIDAPKTESASKQEVLPKTALTKVFTYTELEWQDEKFIRINDREPLVEESCFDYPMPDFLTEDQQNLYRQAHYLFRLLMMYPDEIEDMPRVDGKDFDTAYPTMYLTVPDPDGYAVGFCPVNGRYSTWTDFVSMGTAVFTDELFEKLYQKNFFRINDGTYYLNEREGSGYYYEDPAVSYNLISSTDTEIEFEAVKHIFRFPDTEDDAAKTISLPVKMILTEEGWRVSMMDFEYDGELIEKDEDAYSKTMAEIYDTEKLVINYSYECEKFTIIHGIQMTGMKNGQRLWILLPDGSCSDISRKFDFNNNIRLNDFRVLYDETVLFCVDEEADRYPGSTIEYQIDIMTGEIISKTQVVRTPLE